MKRTKLIAAVLAAVLLASACLSVSADNLIGYTGPQPVTGSTPGTQSLIMGPNGEIWFFNGNTIIPASLRTNGYTGGTYTYDPTTGFYYDASTGYFYDPTTGQYFPNVNAAGYGLPYNYISGNPYDPNSYAYYQYLNNLNNVTTHAMTMDQYTTVSFGNQYVAYSDDPTVVSVSGTMLYALKAGTANVTLYSVSNSTISMRYQITVNAVTIDPSNYYVNVYAQPYIIAVGSTAAIYTEVFYNNQRVDMAVDLTLDPNANGIVTLDASGRTVTGVGVGTATVIATLHGTNVSNAVNITVANGNTINYNDPYYYYGGYPYYYPTQTQTQYGTWTITTPGTGSILNYLIGANGVPYYVNPYGSGSTILNPYTPYYQNGTYDSQAAYNAYLKSQGIDTDKYNVEYKTMFINGEYRNFMVLVPKDNSKTTTGTTTTPSQTTTKQPTAEELQKAAEDAARRALEAAEKKAKAEKEAAEKATAAKVEKAQKGKLGWDEVYSDLHKDSYYFSAVRYFLDAGVIKGHETGYFGTNEILRKGEIEEILASYYKYVTGKDYKVSDVDKDVVLSRQDLAQVMFDFAKKLGIDTSARKDLTRYDDAKKIDAKYKDAYSWVIATSVFNKTESSVLVDKPVDRARFIVMLSNLDDLLAE